MMNPKVKSMMNPETKVKIIRGLILLLVIGLIIGMIVLVIHATSSGGNSGSGGNNTCSTENIDGTCPGGKVCDNGVCITQGGDTCTKTSDCNNGKCVQSNDGKVCDCDDYYLAPNCKNTCTKGGNECQNGGKCFYESGVWKCNCAGGFAGEHCQTPDAPRPQCPKDKHGNICGEFGEEICEQQDDGTAICKCPPYYGKSPSCSPADADSPGTCVATTPGWGVNCSMNSNSCSNGYWCTGNPGTFGSCYNTCTPAPSAWIDLNGNIKGTSIESTVCATGYGSGVWDNGTFCGKCATESTKGDGRTAWEAWDDKFGSKFPYKLVKDSNNKLSWKTSESTSSFC